MYGSKGMSLGRFPNDVARGGASGSERVGPVRPQYVSNQQQYSYQNQNQPGSFAKFTTPNNERENEVSGRFGSSSSGN
jgi:hypothetical protein